MKEKAKRKKKEDIGVGKEEKNEHKIKFRGQCERSEVRRERKRQVNERDMKGKKETE